MPFDKQKMEQALIAATKELTDSATWKEQGFTEKITFAFAAAAEFTNSVVSTRVPGAATTQLIKEQYDQKGFFIKAKSCDWGPMAGFLCRNPAFNKKGARGINDNRSAHFQYKDYLVKLFQNGASHADFQKRAFIPLMISDERKKQFLKESGVADPFQDGPVEHFDDGSGKIYGIATTDDRAANARFGSVIAEFLMVKTVVRQQNKDLVLWRLYHGNVFTLESPGGKYIEYQAGKPFPADSSADPQVEEAIKQAETKLPFEPVQNNRLNHVLQSVLKSARTIREFWFSIDGIMNPHPAYPGGTEPDYRNAVTGDYDLFTVWPLIPGAGFGNLARVSETAASDDKLKSEFGDLFTPDRVSRKVFLPVADKPFSLELTRSRNLFVEFIPPGALLGKLESKFFGNINEAVFLAAGTLNSLMSTKGYSPNKAFHSDEGGRPGVDEVEYPIAVFLPTLLSAAVSKGLAGGRKIGPCMLINTHAEFLALIELLYRKSFITLNHGWLIHWFSLTQEESRLTAQGANKNGYFARRADERKALKPEELTQITDYLQRLFVRPPEAIQSDASRHALDDYLKKTFDAAAAFSGVQTAFWNMVTSTDKTKTPEDWKQEMLNAL